MNVLVTGGAGYIGGELVYQLSNRSDVNKVVVYDNLSRGNHNLFISNSNKIKNNKVKFVLGELLDSRKLRQVLQDIDVVYHLAARVATPFSDIDSHFFEQTNNWGTAELVYAVEEAPRVQKFVYLSTTSVYGSSKDYVTENAPPNPRTFYSISKMRGEDHVRRLMDKIDTYILRCGNVYGYSPSIRFDAVINRFLFDANFNNRISIHGSGKQNRSFVHVHKLVQCLLFLLEKKIPSDIYNITDRNLSVLDIVDVLKEMYPDLEFIFINQHLALRELKVDTNTKFSEYYPLPQTNFRDELEEFKNRFAFSSIQEEPA